MTIHVKITSKKHPRGWQAALELPEGSSSEELLAHLLTLEDFSGCDESLFKGLVVIRNGLITPRKTVLEDGDRLQIIKLMAGG